MTEMRQDTTQCCRERYRSSLPFWVMGVLAILVGGLLAAAVAHEPVRDLVWMVAYLVLVMGLAQVAFGAGQVVLADKPLSGMIIAAQFVLFNLGNIGVIYGTLANTFIPVAVGTLLILLGLGMFMLGARGSNGGKLRHGYHGLLGLIAIGALVGLLLSALANFG